MSIESAKDLEALERIGRIVALALREMGRCLTPGMSTAELDEIGRVILERFAARPAPKLAYDFPGTTCISINDEAAHGIPGQRTIRHGDLVNIDVSAELDGYFADTGATFPVPPVSDKKQQLCQHSRRALRRAIGAARTGKRMNAIGREIENEARRGGFQVIRNLAGHGVGRSLHEYPDSLTSYYNPHDRRRFSHGLVVAIETFLSTGAREVCTASDSWTLETPDGSLVAQYEHTVIVRGHKPIVVTSQQAVGNLAV